MAPTFPVINYAGAKWGFSLPWLMYIAFAYQDYREITTFPPYHNLHNMGKTERFFHEKVMHDLETNQPQLILIDNSVQKEWLGKMQFDFIQYFSKDPRFVQLWRNYKWVSRVTNPSQTIVFDFYQLQAIRRAPDKDRQRGFCVKPKNLYVKARWLFWSPK